MLGLQINNVGDAGDGSIYSVWLVELGGETCLRCLEIGASMSDVVVMQIG